MFTYHMVKDAIWSLKYNWNKDDWEFDEFYMDVIMTIILIIIIPFIIVFDIVSLPLEITYLIIKHHKKVKKQKEINEWKELNGLK